MRVCDLIKPLSGDWNVEPVYSLFPSYVAREILEIKILPILQLDKLIWAREKRWFYSMRSSYRRVFEEKQPHVGETSTLVEVKLFWMNLWKLQVPNKIKMMASRACSKILSMMQ